eukprot:44956-Prorocentrum_minimum.AAC.1
MLLSVVTGDHSPSPVPAVLFGVEVHLQRLRPTIPPRPPVPLIYLGCVSIGSAYPRPDLENHREIGKITGNSGKSQEHQENHWENRKVTGKTGKSQGKQESHRNIRKVTGKTGKPQGKQESDGDFDDLVEAASLVWGAQVPHLRGQQRRWGCAAGPNREGPAGGRGVPTGRGRPRGGPSGGAGAALPVPPPPARPLGPLP